MKEKQQLHNSIDDRRKESLLERICRYSGCDYLSDLHEKKYCAAALDLMLQEENDQYSLREWEDSLSYVLQTNIAGPSIEEVKQRGRSYAKMNHLL